MWVVRGAGRHSRRCRDCGHSGGCSGSGRPQRFLLLSICGAYSAPQSTPTGMPCWEQHLPPPRSLLLVACTLCVAPSPMPRSPAQRPGALPRLRGPELLPGHGGQAFGEGEWQPEPGNGPGRGTGTGEVLLAPLGQPPIPWVRQGGGGGAKAPVQGGGMLGWPGQLGGAKMTGSRPTDILGRQTAEHTGDRPRALATRHTVNREKGGGHDNCGQVLHCEYFLASAVDPRKGQSREAKNGVAKAQHRRKKGPLQTQTQRTKRLASRPLVGYESVDPGHPY